MSKDMKTNVHEIKDSKVFVIQKIIICQNRTSLKVTISQQ